jgi:hypothetical protein
MRPKYVIIGLITLAVIATVLHYWMECRYQRTMLYKTQWIMQKKQQQYDYVVLGASHAYVGFDVGVADSMLQKKGINISLDGSLIGTQSVLADLFFNRNQNKTPTLFFCIDNPSAINTEVLADIADGRMMPYMKYHEVFNFYKPYGVKWYFDRYVPMWKYAEYNYYWGPHIFANTWANYMKPDFDTVSGSRYDYGNYYDNSDTMTVSLDFQLKEAESGYKYFKKIIQVCRQNNITPVLFTLPLGRADTSAEAKQHLADFNAYCKKEGLDFYYLGDYLNYEFKYFGTKGHLNKKGAELATQKFISEYLAKQPAK